MKAPAKPISLPGLAESVVEDVVESVAQDVEWLLDSFMPDGRPFGMEKLSEEEQIQKYLADGLHDNPEAAANWIRQKVNDLIQMMTIFGVTQDKIASVHPYDIVETAALIWSAHMERLIKERESRTAPTEPPVPQSPTEAQAWPFPQTQEIPSTPQP